MAVLIEPLLRNTELSDEEKLVCLRGIAQVAAADGTVDAAERAYLEKFVEEFFEEDPRDSRFDEPIEPKDLEVLSSDRAKDSFVAFLYVTAYLDEDFSEPEKEFIEKLTKDLVSEQRRAELLQGVQEFLYRRAVFAYAFRNNRLDEEFARAAAARFQVPESRAVELNAQVFNALMALKAPTAQEAESGAEA